jgi:hypothetical protein
LAPAPRELCAERWPEFFGSLDRECNGMYASVEVVPAPPLDGGVGHRPLREVRYDARRQMLELAVGASRRGEFAVRYFLCDLRAVRVLEKGELTAIFVEDAVGVFTLIRLIRDVARRTTEASA